MVKEYVRPSSIDEALESLTARGAAALAGGTALLAFERKEKPERIVDLGEILSHVVERRGMELFIGSGVTFQELLESQQTPAPVKAAARTMANRNTRNRATVGGNLGAGKSCSSLAPVLLVLGAAVDYQERGRAVASVPLADWLAAPAGIILSVRAPLEPGLRVASLRVSRTACDVATATAACAYRLDGGKLSGLRIAVGGFGPRPALRPDISARFEGGPLPTVADIETVVAPLLSAISDQRGSAEYKRARGASLVADAMHAAEELQ